MLLDISRTCCPQANIRNVTTYTMPPGVSANSLSTALAMDIHYYHVDENAVAVMGRLLDVGAVWRTGLANESEGKDKRAHSQP